MSKVGGQRVIHDTLIVGTGLSAWSVVTALPSLENVHIIDGGAKIRLGNFISNKHLGLKTKFGSTHPFAEPASLNLVDESTNQLPASLSRGGLSEVWGNGFTPYRFSELDQRGLVQDSEIFTSMKELLDLVPHVSDNKLLESRFDEIQKHGELTDYEGVDTHPFFEKLIKELPSQSRSKFTYGKPFLFLNKSLCTKCGLCLSGCPYGALFDAGENISRLILGGKLKSDQVLSGIVTKLTPELDCISVEYSNLSGKYTKKFRKVILSAGPVSTAIILMRSKLINADFNIPDSQVFYFAGISKKRVRPIEEIAQIGQVAVYPQEVASGDFQVGFYAPSEVSRARISKSLLLGPLKHLMIPKFVSERLLPGIGFLPQESSGYLNLRLRGESIILSRVSNQKSKMEAGRVIRGLIPFFRSTQLRILRVSLRIPDAGSGFHLGASLPFDGKDVDEIGRLREEPRIKIMDASLLPSIPAGAHTFMSMALIRYLIKKES
jgi:ferredoxin